METTFKKSESIAELAKALMIFSKEVKPIPRNGTNPHFHSTFATLDDIVVGIAGPLEKSDLSYIQMPTGENQLVTVLMHKSGEFMESTVKMVPKENTPQGQGSAITYMRRYSLSAMLGLSTGELDDDGNGASTPEKKPATPAAPANKKIDPLFEKAKQNLVLNKDPKKLEDFRAKIASSTKYDEKQKVELFAVIDELIVKLSKKK
jgi:hypothetical protein